MQHRKRGRKGANGRLRPIRMQKPAQLVGIHGHGVVKALQIIRPPAPPSQHPAPCRLPAAPGSPAPAHTHGTGRPCRWGCCTRRNSRSARRRRWDEMACLSSETAHIWAKSLRWKYSSSSWRTSSWLLPAGRLAMAVAVAAQRRKTDKCFIRRLLLWPWDSGQKQPWRRGKAELTNLWIFWLKLW